MRERICIFVVVIFLICETWRLESAVISAHNLGSEVNLSCESNKTWHDILFVTWTMKLTDRQCTLGIIRTGAISDSCHDGKSLKNKSRSEPYLHIPNFSNSDVGIYTCHSAFYGGAKTFTITLTITVPPSISSWLEWKNDKLVAVCKAEKGKPAADITWSHKGNSSTVKTQSQSDGSFSVESHLQLPEVTETKNLTCIVSHPYWNSVKFLTPKLQKGLHFYLVCVLVVLTTLIILAGVLLFSQKKLIMQRCEDNTSVSKSPAGEHVEELEPYACFVQRVNSIYNS